jgi:hypothetical protein
MFSVQQYCLLLMLFTSVALTRHGALTPYLKRGGCGRKGLAPRLAHWFDSLCSCPYGDPDTKRWEAQYEESRAKTCSSRVRYEGDWAKNVLFRSLEKRSGVRLD